jgi:hypothetical protein
MVILEAEPPITMYAQAVVYSNWPEWQMFMDVVVLAFAAFILFAGICEVHGTVKWWIGKRKQK